jgi:glycosyltransferase involved in cell wall biosynthesis
LDSNPQEEKAKNDYKLKLASIFNQYQLSGRVFFLGQRYDVNNIFPDLDTLVIPSQFETFGRVAVEAACFGVPLVAYRGGGLPEIFLDQQEIIFVNPADIQALAEGVLSLLKSPQKKETQIKKAREKALKFTSDESVRSLEKIYRELLGASS